MNLNKYYIISAIIFILVLLLIYWVSYNRDGLETTKQLDPKILLQNTWKIENTSFGINIDKNSNYCLQIIDLNNKNNGKCNTFSNLSTKIVNSSLYLIKPDKSVLAIFSTFPNGQHFVVINDPRFPALSGPISAIPIRQPNQIKSC